MGGRLLLAPGPGPVSGVHPGPAIGSSSRPWSPAPIEAAEVLVRREVDPLVRSRESGSRPARSPPYSPRRYGVVDDLGHLLGDSVALLGPPLRELDQVSCVGLAEHRDLLVGGHLLPSGGPVLRSPTSAGQPAPQEIHEDVGDDGGEKTPDIARGPSAKAGPAEAPTLGFGDEAVVLHLQVRRHVARKALSSRSSREVTAPATPAPGEYAPRHQDGAADRRL